MMKTSDVCLTTSLDSIENPPLTAFLRLTAKRWRRWLVFVAISSVTVFAASLLLVPQTYKSDTSLVIVPPFNAGASLGAAVGLGPSANGKYVAVLDSRRLAEMVEDRIHVQQLYHLQNRADAIDCIMDSLRAVDDPAKGVIEVSCSMSGPPYLWLWPGAKRERDQVKQTAAQTVNLYAEFLRDYMKHSDIDGNASLAKGAAEEIRKEREDYDISVERLAKFAREKGDHMDRGTMAMALTEDGNSIATPSAGKDYGSLYMTRASLESDIQAATVAMNNLKAAQANQLRNVGDLPAEDPLLIKARGDVSAAKSDYEALRLQFGPVNPRVTIAQDRLRIAQNALDKQMESVRMGRATPSIDEQIKLQSLETRRTSVIRQIAVEESKAKIGRDSMTEFTRLRGEVLIRLAALKEASAGGARLAITSVASSTKLAVVDVGIPARKGLQKPSLLAVVSVMLSLIGLIVWSLPDYRRTIREVMANNDRAVEAPGTRTQAA